MKFKCQVCGYVYDEEKEKVPFADLPETWKCPLCGAPKSQFAPEEDEAAASASAEPAKATEHVAKPAEETAEQPASQVIGDGRLSIGQLAALCSNLARGCEKQYMEEEAGLFRQLSDHLTSITPAVQDASVEMIEASLAKDIEDYPTVRQTVDADGDRGAARALTWGEKVSRILSSLVERYLKEGESMLDGQDVWLCTICGFVYVGNDLPELCPVCKVPSWKFEKIEGRA